MVLRQNKKTVEKQLNDLKERATKLQLQKADIAKRSKELIERESLVEQLAKKTENLKEELTVSKTQLQVKQDAFEKNRKFEGGVNRL